MKDQVSLSRASVPALLKHLKSLFPLQNPEVHDSLSTIQRKAGHQDVLAYIEMKLKEEKEINMESQA